MAFKSPPALTFARFGGVLAVAAAALSSSQVFACQYECESSSSEAFPAYLKSNPTVRVLGLGQLTTISEVAKAGRSGVAGGRTTSLNLGTGLAGAAGDPRWNGWTALSYNSVGYGFAPLASSGSVNNLLAGFDYSYDGGSLLGVAIGSDSSRTSTTFNGGNVNSRGYSLAPYFMVPFGAHWTLDGSIGLGSGKVDSNVGASVTGNTSESRGFGSLGLTYATMVGKWQLEGNGALLHSATRQGQYTQSNAALIAAATNRVTQLRGGMRASYGSGSFVPFFGAALSTDLDQTASGAVGGQTPSNAREAVYLQAGFSFNPGKKVSGSVQFSSELRDQVRNNGIVATLSLKF